MDWARMLAYITGTVDQELLLRHEYLVAENRILKAQIKGRLLLSDAETGMRCRNGVQGFGVASDQPSARPRCHDQSIRRRK